MKKIKEKTNQEKKRICIDNDRMRFFRIIEKTTDVIERMSEK